MQVLPYSDLGIIGSWVRV